MEEVEGVYNGTFDYSLLKGDTGPLVYGGGFVSIYYILYLITEFGKSIRLAQHLFGFLYVLNLFIVFLIYKESKNTPYYIIVLLCLSRRIHSVFVLRLFNDCFGMFFIYFAIYLFLRDRWTLGCLIYSFSVSIKMNGLLFAPGVGLLMLRRFGWKKTLTNIFWCILVQVIFGLPFLVTNFFSYLKGTFDIGRVFQYKWSVNWQFIPAHLFVTQTWGILMLTCTVLVWLFFIFRKWNHPKELKKILFSWKSNEKLSGTYIITVLFTSNFIGIIFARSLHYQFYSWYFHTIPYLLWVTTMHPVIKLILLFLIEFCWNMYPPSMNVSLLLFFCHMALLWNLYHAPREMLN